MVKDQEKISQLTSRNDLNFSDALFLLKNGYEMRRTNWQDILFIAMQKPDENSKMKRPYLYCVPADRQAFPYTVSNADLFMQDWEIKKE